MAGTQAVVVAIAADDEALVPEYQTESAAGADLRSASRLPIVIVPGSRVLVPCGVRLSIPAGFEGQVRARSGLAYALGLCVLNAPGTIDSDYRGEIKVLLANLGHQTAVIRYADRIAQLVISPVVQVGFVTKPLVPTRRGSDGFGSTGTA